MWVMSVASVCGWYVKAKWESWRWNGKIRETHQQKRLWMVIESATKNTQNFPFTWCSDSPRGSPLFHLWFWFLWTRKSSVSTLAMMNPGVVRHFVFIVLVPTLAPWRRCWKQVSEVKISLLDWQIKNNQNDTCQRPQGGLLACNELQWAAFDRQN